LNVWIQGIEELAAKPVDLEKDWEKHCAWWKDFWNRGWIIASDLTVPADQREKFNGEANAKGKREESDGAAVVAQSYNFFRFAMGAQSRGRYQARFNGGLFNQQQKISDESLLDSLDYDVEKEDQKKNKEMNRQITTSRKLQKSQVEMQGEAAITTAKYQALAQKRQMEIGMAGATNQQGQQQAPGQPQAQGTPGQADGQQAAQQVPGMPQGASVSLENAQVEQPMIGGQSPLSIKNQGGLDLNYLGLSAKKALEDMDPLTKQNELNNMKAQNPELFKTVMQLINSTKGSQENPLDPLEMPMPKVKPPRRNQ
jgi:hypothetical protein